MSQISLKAQDVIGQGGVQRIPIGDIEGIITTLIGLFKNCRKTPAQAARVLRRFVPVQRQRVKQIIKDRLGRDNARLAVNVELVANQTTVAEVEEMYQEVLV